ncbi:aldolase catalytic domain-containing protein [uncultured Gemmiger sp.]|uniref:aldolase catalytic domain-containing protein n=1 Tax=uncultured Gemmiger sp. TaxID=1623490 RepID=UPI0025CB971B|nr:aldolase catalytic domain-containing protein [uncultured Gemmiger sp.]
MPNVKLLDCTLRDGGYVNDWRWGFAPAREIVRTLTRAGTDIVEVGFLRNVGEYNPDVTVCNTIEELNRLLPEDTRHTMYSGMAMRSNYDIAKLSEYSGRGIEMIRITAHDYDIREGMDFAREVKARGYKLSINPINIMGYSDRDILWILDQVNAILPYQFSIVDTFGSMRRRDLERIVSLVDHNLDPSIRVGLHLHENMALSFCLAQEFIDKHLRRDTTVDASLMGMGRIPGNLPIELVADYMNDTLGTHYDIDELMDAIQDYIAPLKGETQWGYTPAYFLSARFNLHRDYAEHYLAKGDLTNRDINHILSGFDHAKATAYDPAYADRLYAEYQDRRVDDAAALEQLKAAFGGKRVLVLAPGATLADPATQARVATLRGAADGADVTISANFVPEFTVPDYAFFTNSKRLDKMAAFPCPVILTSNLRPQVQPARCCVVGYDRVAGAFAQGSNSVIMLLRLLAGCGAKAVLLAGADGYAEGRPAYADASLHAHTGRGPAFHAAMAEAIRGCGVPVTFVTPSAYERA